MKTVYIESSIPGYSIYKPNPSLIVTARQQQTELWWQESSSLFSLFVSPLVLREIGAGNALLAQQRLNVVNNIPSLPITTEAKQLAATYIKRLSLQKSQADALHIAIAVAHRLDFLLTWNCKHIANGEIVKRLQRLNLQLGYATPGIVTPELLMNLQDE